MKKKFDDRNKEIFFRPLEISTRQNEDIEKTIKRFTRKVKKDGIIREFVERRSYMKPSDKKRLKLAKSIWNSQINSEKK